MISEVIILSLKITLIIGLIIIIINFIAYNNFLKKEKRIAHFAVESLHNNEKSIIEKLTSKYLNFVENKRPFIKKRFKKSIKKYKKNLTYNKNNENYPIDFITYKLTISISFIILASITCLLQGRFISIIEIIIYYLFGYYLLDVFTIQKNKNYQKQIDEQLLRAIIIMNNAFKAGKSTIQAVNVVSKELPKPISEEFTQIYKEMSYGLSIEVAFDRFSKRVKSPEAKYIASSLTILNKTGGNIIKVFTSIEKTLYDKKKLIEEQKMLTTSSNAMVKLLLALPIIFIIIISILSPDFFKPLFDSVLGYMIIIFAIFLFAIYIYILKKTLKVKV